MIILCSDPVSQLEHALYLFHLNWTNCMFIILTLSRIELYNNKILLKECINKVGISLILSSEKMDDETLSLVLKVLVQFLH